MGNKLLVTVNSHIEQFTVHDINVHMVINVNIILLNINILLIFIMDNNMLSNVVK